VHIAYKYNKKRERYINFKIKMLLLVVAAICSTALFVFCSDAYKTTIVIEEKEQKNDQNIEKNKSEKKVSNTADHIAFINMLINRIYKENSSHISIPFSSNINIKQKNMKNMDELPEDIKKKIEKTKKNNKKNISISKTTIASDSSCDEIKRNVDKLKSDILEDRISDEELKKAKKTAVNLSETPTENEVENKNCENDLDSVTFNSLKDMIKSNNFTISVDDSGHVTINSDEKLS